MIIDITSIRNSIININDSVLIPDNYLENTEIIALNSVFFKGTLEEKQELFELIGVLNVTMTIRDSISLEPIQYDFSIEIDEEIEENLEKSKNYLDITEILWQNIILEVPLKLTTVNNFDEYHGDGWKLISEDSNEFTNNPFKELKDMLGKE